MNTILKFFNAVLGIINQLPEKQKLKTSPTYRSTPPKSKSKKVRPKIKPQGKKGPRHTEETTFNHPRR